MLQNLSKYLLNIMRYVLITFSVNMFIYVESFFFQLNNLDISMSRPNSIDHALKQMSKKKIVKIALLCTEILHFLYFSISTMVAMETGHFLKMLNDANLASLGFLMWKVLGCIICKKNIVCTLVQGWTNKYLFGCRTMLLDLSAAFDISSCN